MIKNQLNIREENESMILNAVIKNGRISRAGLSQVTGLNKASVSEIIKKMIEEKLIVEVGMGEAQTSGGRKPMLLEFNEKKSLLAAVDIGSNYISVALCYLDGTFVDQIFNDNIDINKENASLLIIQYIDDLKSKQDLEIEGLCVAIHGSVLNNKIIFTPAYDLDSSSLYDDLSTYYDFPVYFENEANLSALGEYVFGSNSKQLISLSIHSGIGAGIISKGHIEEGFTGQAGEIGHTILYPMGRKCPCGNNGCLEQYASKKTLYDSIKEAKKLDYIYSDILQDLDREKDKKVCELVDENAHYIAIAINNSNKWFILS